MAVAQGLSSKMGPADTEDIADADSSLKAGSKKKIKKVKKVVLGEEIADSTWDIPAISLPNGCNSLPLELIPLLERFTKIYLWLDNDKSGSLTPYH